MAPKKRAGGGKKSFLKGVSRGELDETDAELAPSEESQQQCTAEEATSDSIAQPVGLTGISAASTSAAVPQTLNTAGGGAGASGKVDENLGVNDTDIDGRSGGGETRGQMLQRHKKEVKAMKETVKKMGKKRKDESLALEASLESRHVAELSAVDSRLAAEAQQELSRQQAAGEVVATEEEDAVAAALAANSLYGKSAASEHQESSRAQKRKQKVTAQGAEREARIAMELAEAGDSERQLEEAALRELLLPLGFAVRDIQPDGNCMYRAVEDQLQLRDGGQGLGLSSYSELRQRAVDRMREREVEFLPFFAQDEEGEDKGDDAHERFQGYCSRMSEAAAWGSQLELGALAQCLRQRIDIYSVGLPTVLMGDEFEGEPLRVCYLRHAYGMGEHYNSIGLAAGSDHECEQN